MAPLLTPWAPGPEAGSTDDVVVSVTDFALARRRDMPRVVTTGLRLRMGWFAMDGAVGLWLWSLPRERRSGSISVWTGEEHLRRFVALPAHVAIMRRYRDSGTLKSTDWKAERFSGPAVLRAARGWIAGGTR